MAMCPTENAVAGSCVWRLEFGEVAIRGGVNNNTQKVASTFDGLDL